MDIMDMNGGIENDDYFNQNEENAEVVQPKSKKLRKLVRKNKGQSSSDEDNNIFGQDDDNNNNNKMNNNTDSNEIDNNQFENKLLIQGNGDIDQEKKVTYKSKLDELSEQIAQMDQEKKAKKQRRSSNKKKTFSEDNNEYQYLDDDEEKKISENPTQKAQKTKKQKPQAEVEKNEDMVKRLADKFNEEDEEDNENNYQEEDIDDDYELNPDSNKRKKKNTKGAAKANQNAGMIKSNNKLFKEINALEQNNLDNIEEQPVEEEYLQEESIKFERNNNKNQKNLLGFLKQSMIYKKQRGLEYENSQNKLKDIIQHEKSQSLASRSVATNQEEQQAGDMKLSQNLEKKDSFNEMEIGAASGQIQFNTATSQNVNSDDSQKLVDFSNVQRQISSTSIGGLAASNSQDHKLSLLKKSSQKIQKMLSFSQSQNLSQVPSNKMTQSQDEDLELELHVPTVDSTQKHQSLTNNTLFFNKIIRTNNQSLLMKQSSTVSTNSNNSQLALGSQLSNANDKKKNFSRNEYLKLGQKRITERKSQNLNLQSVSSTFKQTSFDHLLSSKDKKKSKDSANAADSSERGEDAEKSKNEASNDGDHENDSQNTENDSDFDPNQVESEGEEGNNEKKEKVEESDETKQRQLIEAEIQYRKLLALEEGIDEKEFERQIRLEYGIMDEQDQENAESGEEGEDEEERKDNSLDESEEEQDYEKQLEAYEAEIDNMKKDNNEMVDEALEEKKPMRRLKNIAAEILKKEQEKKQKEQLRQQKEERRKQLLNNPIMKKIMNDMIEDEAELGSDNEENDDKIKDIDNEDEHREAGLNKDEDLDAELKELINNVVDFNEEHEQFAASKFIRDLARRDKEEIKKIIEGAYKGTRAKKRNLSDLLEDDGETSESKKLKRIKDAIRTLQDQAEENQYSDEDGDEEDFFDPVTGILKPRRSKGKRNGKDLDEEKEQIQMREANLLLKKEYERVSGQNKFDEKKLVDSSVLDLIQKKQNNTVGNSSLRNSTMNSGGMFNSKKIIPTKISDNVGQLKGNLSSGSNSSLLVSQMTNTTPASNLQKGNAFNNLRTSNIKNSILHVKNNKNRFSQFNDSFNKESLINEFGESALAKAFQNYADHSQSIFYSKQNNEDSNSRPLEKDKGNKLTKQGSTQNQNLSGAGSSSQNFKNISSINKLFKSNSVSSSGPTPNTFTQFGRKKFSTTSNDSKN